MITVQATQEMYDFLQRIKVNEYKVVGTEIHIDLVGQQLWYRMNADYATGINIHSSKEYVILHDIIFGKHA